MPAPSRIRIGFAQSEAPIECRSLAEMDSALDRLHRETLAVLTENDEHCPLQVTIYFPDHEIYSGLGSAQSFLMVGTEPFDRWYVALGDENADGSSKMFYGDAQDTYWQPKHLIPLAAAREAIRYYVEHQQRSPLLRWEC